MAAVEPPLDTRELSPASAHAIVKHTRLFPFPWFDRVFSPGQPISPVRHRCRAILPSTRRVSADRKRNEKVERANRVARNQRGKGEEYRHCDVSNAIGQPIFEADKKSRDS